MGLWVPSLWTGPSGPSAYQRRTRGAAAGYSSAFSLAFDGTGDYVDFGSAFPDLDGVCSISLWYKIDAVGANQCLLSDGLFGQFAIRVNASGNIDWFQGATPGSATFFGGGSGSNPVADDTWYHALFVRTGSSGNWSVACYINGTQDGSSPDTITDNPPASPANVRFGQLTGIGQEFDGWLDEIAVWTSDQSAQAAGLADGSVDPASLSPVGFWRFEEGSGSTAGDDGSGGNDGAITNATYSADIPGPLA